MRLKYKLKASPVYHLIGEQALGFCYFCVISIEANLKAVHTWENKARVPTSYPPVLRPEIFPVHSMWEKKSKVQIFHTEVHLSRCSKRDSSSF